MTSTASQGSGTQSGSGYSVAGSGSGTGSEYGLGYSVTGSGSGSGSGSESGEAELADGSWLAGLAMGDSPRPVSPNTLLLALATLSITLSVLY